MSILGTGHCAELTFSISYKLNKDSASHPGYIQDENNRLGSLQVHYQDNAFELRTLYDIVGWILSVVGSVPNIATRENYYYPLVMIGYIFSAKLIPTGPVIKKGKKAISSPGPPGVWTTIWFKQNHVWRVVVGATLDSPGGDSKKIVKDYRKNLLRESHILTWGQALTPVQLARGVTGQDFGHCAETYPLLFICS